MSIPKLSPHVLRRPFGKVYRGGIISQRRPLLTLAIETSCDDTSVAIVEKSDDAHSPSAKIHFLENITADTRQYRGIHPIVALDSHQENLAKLVKKSLQYLPPAALEQRCDAGHITLDYDGRPRRRPDFISATRGPGMRSNLSVGLDTGKALAVAWQIPFIGVHHMQAHLLTPRLAASLVEEGDDKSTRQPLKFAAPHFPFLSLLISGGHTILVKSTSLTDHEIMAESADIAIGESLDKAARDILPTTVLETAKNTMFGKQLEDFAFPNGPLDYADYKPPGSRGEEVVKRQSQWGWSLTTPFAQTRQLQFSFSSVPSAVKKLHLQKTKAEQTMSTDERIALARESMRVCFEHLASRTTIALESLASQANNNDYDDEHTQEQIRTLVVSGGVAANRFLMTVLRSFLDVRGFGHVDIIAPPPYLCTDNAAMIGWAGIEMFEAGWRSDLSCRALRKWSLDARADDGGVLGPSAWIRG